MNLVKIDFHAANSNEQEVLKDVFRDFPQKKWGSVYSEAPS
jgi:hypothetical protein